MTTMITQITISGPDVGVIDTSPTITAADITDATSTGRAVLTGDAAAGRAALGLGSAATASAASFDAAGSAAAAQAAAISASQPVDSDLTAIAALSTTSFGRSLLTAADAAAARTAIGAASVSGAGVPSAFTSRALTADDNGGNLICATSQTATVNAGLGSGFGCSFKGAISFDGTATVTDVRTTGAVNPWCALVQTATDTYDAVGGKA